MLRYLDAYKDGACASDVVARTRELKAPQGSASDARGTRGRGRTGKRGVKEEGRQRRKKGAMRM